MMDYDFFEGAYYYSQHSPQGETISDDLSWLIYPIVIDLDPKEQVGNPVDVAIEAMIFPPP